MIITRSPLRITLGGGGTDLPSYYREHGGFLIAAAIDKYVYVTVMRPFAPGIYLKYSKLEHVDDRRRGPPSDHPRGHPAARIQNAADRNHHARRHPRRHGTRIVGQLYDGAAEGAVRPPPPAAASERARGARLRDRDRAAQGADRQAGPIHRGVRRPDLLHIPQGRQRRSRAPQAADGHDASISRTTCCCSSPASRGAPAASSPTSTTARERTTARCSQPALRQGARAAQSRGARVGRTRGVRRADARALGAQETAHRRA